MCVCAASSMQRRPRTPRRASPAMLRLAALAVLCAALAHANHPKRAEMSPVPFLMASRYGRSSERVMSPRIDRFYMSSRYGKRDDTHSMEQATEVVPINEGDSSGQCGQNMCGRPLVCEYTGILTLYKCVHTHLQIARRSNDDTGPGEQV